MGPSYVSNDSGIVVDNNYHHPQYYYLQPSTMAAPNVTTMMSNMNISCTNQNTSP